MDHFLFSCLYSQHCWTIARLNFPHLEEISPEEKILKCFESLSTKELELFCAITWSLWDHRNKVVWRNHFQSPASTVNSASTILFQWQQVQANHFCSVSLNQREGVVSWQRPIAGWYTCNVDAAVFSEEMRSSFGCLIRDELGNFVAGCGGNLWGIIDPKVAEAMAFREALSWLKRLAATNVFIELDSLGVVQAFRNNSDDASFLGSIIRDCCTLVKDLRSYSVYFIRRSANLAAHTIARVANSRSDREEWSSIPSFLIDVIVSDNQ